MTATPSRGGIATDFFACDHPWDRKYVVNGPGIVCLDCDLTTFVVRWDEPGSDPLGDIKRWAEKHR